MVIGITGGVGAGKSGVLQFLQQEFHARILEADRIAADLMEPGGACYERIVELAGRGILQEDGRLNRPLLAGRMFGDETLRNHINRVVHPAVFSEIQRIVGKSREEKLWVVEAALLFEGGLDKLCNEIWYIYAPEKIRVLRLMAQRGYTEEKTHAIMARQKTEEEFRQLCSRTIDNGGDFSLTQQQIRQALIGRPF